MAIVSGTTIGFKRALVTGASGIVGFPLCRALASAGVQVTALSRSAETVNFPKNVFQLAGDILEQESLTKAADGVDVVFHVAAAVHGSAKNHREFERVNVTGTENVLRAVEATGARLVHVSTVNVAGYRTGKLDDAYAETKSRAEDLVTDAVEDGIDAVIIRPATVFGSESGRSGLVVDRLLKGSLKILPSPARKISPVWSVDLAQALIASASVGERGEIYTVAGPTVTTGEFVTQICKHGSLKSPLVTIPGWMFAVPLQILWWLRTLTRWTPPVTVGSLLSGSVHDGAVAAKELGFEYTPLDRIFGA